LSEASKTEDDPGPTIFQKQKGIEASQSFQGFMVPKISPHHQPSVLNVNHWRKKSPIIQPVWWTWICFKLFLRFRHIDICKKRWHLFQPWKWNGIWCDKALSPLAKENIWQGGFFFVSVSNQKLWLVGTLQRSDTSNHSCEENQVVIRVR